MVKIAIVMKILQSSYKFQYDAICKILRVSIFLKKEMAMFEYRLKLMHCMLILLPFIKFHVMRASQFNLKSHIEKSGAKKELYHGHVTDFISPDSYNSDDASPGLSDNESSVVFSPIYNRSHCPQVLLTALKDTSDDDLGVNSSTVTPSQVVQNIIPFQRQGSDVSLESMIASISTSSLLSRIAQEQVDEQSVDIDEHTSDVVNLISTTKNK